ncbi:type II toxin-antitoxin system HicA family toxin [Candidatus Gottesmanbacteria bacterium]|nr:type II toxin-antitoxin system HicA family toxin [Candidatus Gottesmanbacteria bacterium]
MSSLGNFKPREVEAVLFRAGFIIDTKSGSHRSYYHPIRKVHATIAFHPGTIPTGTLRAIIRQTGMTGDEFLSYSKKRKY